MSIYLEAADYSAFGVPSTVTPAQVQEASALIDGFVDRPEGLLYDTGVNGNPVGMILTGLPITEISPVPIGGREVVLSRIPVASVIGVAAMRKGIPVLVPVPLATVETNGSPYSNPFSTYAGYAFVLNGRLYLGTRFWEFSDVQVAYVAGWVYANLPAAIKQACANIINEKLTWPTLNGSVTQIKVGDGSVTRSIATALSADTMSLLQPYKRVFAP